MARIDLICTLRWKARRASSLAVLLPPRSAQKNPCFSPPSLCLCDLGARICRYSVSRWNSCSLLLYFDVFWCPLHGLHSELMRLCISVHFDPVWLEYGMLCWILSCFVALPLKNLGILSVLFYVYLLLEFWKSMDSEWYSGLIVFCLIPQMQNEVQYSM